MPLHHNVRVPVPNKTYQRKQNSSVYIYLYTEFFRKNGKPSNRSVNIGKLDPSLNNMLIPNDHYYSHFNHDLDSAFNTEEPFFEGTVSVGYTAAVFQAFSNLNLDSILKEHFPDQYRDIMVVAGYAIREGAVMNYIDDYMENHCCFGCGRALTSQLVSSFHADLGSTDRSAFFIDWIKECAADDYIAYDVTSVSTYSTGIEEAEFGYNRDHDSLRQINIGMFATVKSKLPVYYDNYNGSLTDKNNLEYVLKNARSIGIKNTGIVMDGGFFDEKRLKYMYNEGICFTVGMPGHLDASKEIFNRYRNELFNISNATTYESNYALMTDYEIFGIRGRVLVGLNTTTRDLMMAGLKKDIDKREKELREGKVKKYETVIKKKRYTDLFKITPLENSRYSYELNNEAIEGYSENYGYFLVFTTDEKSSGEDILYYYRAKDVDEKMFYQLKDYMGMKRMRTHQQKTTNGKIFNLFIALIIRNYLYQKMSEYKKINHMTFNKCIRKLENIQLVVRKNQSPRLTKALTKQQRELLEILDLNVEKILEMYKVL